ncbi:hypothetical protein Lal_00031968 [Lupinus albus]|nr:hypothetical protein Lal_00031968 [Lupinus albus]
MQHEGNMNPPIPTKVKGKTNTLGFAPITTPRAQPSITTGFVGKDVIHKKDKDLLVENFVKNILLLTLTRFG